MLCHVFWSQVEYKIVCFIIGDEDYKWDDDVIKDLELRFNKLREFDETLNESTDENTIEMTEKTKDALKRDTIELVANQIHDRLTIFFQ